MKKKILPIYDKNESGHNIDHINYVLDRAQFFNENERLNLNSNMVYTMVTFYDIGHHINAKEHEKISAEIFASDEFMKDYYATEQFKLISEAIEDHRASSGNEPRSIYGKVLATADRDTEIESVFKRTYSYVVRNYPDFSLEEQLDNTYNHICEKFGKCGYAREKIYFKDPQYDKYLQEIDLITGDKEEFIKKFKTANNID